MTEELGRGVPGAELLGRLLEEMAEGFVLHEIIVDDDGRPVDYRFLALNPAFERQSGLRACDVVGRTVLEVLPATEAFWIEHYGQVALTGESMDFEGYSGPLGKWYQARAFSPRPGHVAVVCSDVTATREALEAVEVQRGLLHGIVNSVGVPFFSLDREYLYTSFNDAHAAVMEARYDVEIEIGMPMRLAEWVDEDWADAKAKLDAALRGETLRAEAAYGPVLGERGEVVGVTVIALDTDTDLQQRIEDRNAELKLAHEQVRAARAASDQFLANLSHELRTPLNSIVGFAGVLASGATGPLDEEQSRQVGIIGEAGRRLLAVVNDMLDLSSIESGQMMLEPDTVDAAAVVRDIAGTLATAAEEKGLSLVTRVPASVVAVRTDAKRLRQVLLNLAGNAVKFTREGSVILSLEARDDDVVFCVTDTGPGILPDEIDTIFDPFVQGEADELAKSPGVGLGLAISRRLAHMLGGEVGVCSTPGSGAVFELVLPR
jgi:signal transduction histidine kinase